MASSPPNRERLKFADFEFRSFSDGTCRSRVLLEAPGGTEHEGRSEGLANVEGELRCGANAALRALRGVLSEEVSLELAGTKAVRAFDGTVVIVAIRARDPDGHSRLLGVYSTPGEDRARGAALAVLNATNRLLGNYISRPG